MGLHLGSEKCYAKRRAKGGIAVYFEWFDDETNELGKGEPTMFLARAFKSALSGNRGSAAIPMASAHLYADSKSGGPTYRLLAFAAQACSELGFEPSRMNVRAVADAIVDNLPDLLRMPPEPNPDKFASRKAAPIAEVSLEVDGQTVSAGEIH